MPSEESESIRAGPADTGPLVGRAAVSGRPQNSANLHVPKAMVTRLGHHLIASGLFACKWLRAPAITENALDASQCAYVVSQDARGGCEPKGTPGPTEPEIGVSKRARARRRSTLVR